MARCGAGSRRQCEEFIAQERVKVNGTTITRPGSLVDPKSDHVKFDGTLLRPEPIFHFLLNKPRGVVCSSRGAPRAIDYAPEHAQSLRLFTIGRLDVASEGALILTNDGDLTHLVSHPRFEVSKTYRVEVDGHPTQEALTRMRKGVWLSEGKTGGAKVNVTKRTATRTLLVVKLKEGRHREVRRVCARLGHKVRRLVRTHVGTVALGSLAVGQVRPLSSTEIKNLRSSARTVIRLGTTPKAMVVSRAQRRHRGGPGRRRGPGQRKKKGGTPRQSQRKG